MEINDIIDKVESSEAFNNWENEGDYYLVHFFQMTGQPPHLGYYSKKNDDVVVFLLEDDVKINPPEECFKKEEVVPKLEIDKVKLDIDDAMKTATTLQKEAYSSEIVTKDMLILQAFDSKMIYNVTLITQSLIFINIKVDATDGSIILHKKESILNLKQEG